MAFTGALQLVAEESPIRWARSSPSSSRSSVWDWTWGIPDPADGAGGQPRVRLFVTAVLLQRETGGNLAEILEGAADVIRDRFRILGDIRTSPRRPGSPA